jgi:hypothetical protein
VLPERGSLWAAFEPPDSRRRGRGLYGRGRGHNKGTITVTMRASKRQKEPSIALIFYKLPVSSVTAEVAGSSPVAPAKISVSVRTSS